MDSNSMSDKKGSVAEMERGVTMSGIKEVEVCLEAGGEDKPTRDETPVELLSVETLTVDSKSGTDKEGSIGQAELMVEVKVTMSEVDQRVKVRQKDLKQKQMARRAAWQEEVKAELEKRASAKRQMEGTPRNQITSWKAKQIFSKISVQARKTFRSERTKFLFTDVFPIISQQNSAQGAIPFYEISNCRLVSKLWKDVIDSRLSTISPIYHEAVVSPLLTEYDDTLTLFSTAGSLESFNRKNHRTLNPCPFRQLYLGHPLTMMSGFRQLGTSYWIEMGKLLDRWGKEIWTAEYIFDDGSIEMMYEFLIKYLSLMPNLQELAIMERDRSDNFEAAMLTSLGKDMLGPLKSRMERKPLPELPHLRSILFGKFVPIPVVQAMLEKYGATLQFVKNDGAGFDKYSGGYVDPAQFVTGRELPSMTKYSCSYLTCSRITHWNFQFPLLNELQLTYTNVEEGSKEVGNIFKTVNSCGSSLRRLRLKIQFYIPNPIREHQWKDLIPRGSKLELPQLEWLDFTVERSAIRNVDFLLPLVSLKEMTFTYVTMKWDMMKSAKDGEGLIQFAGFRERLYDSNIWNLLPEIRLVTINTIPIDQPRKTYCDLRLKDSSEFDFEETIPNMTTTRHSREGYRKHHRCEKKGIQLVTEQLATFTAK